ncbi:MAG TPA: pyridoxal phosphate-dependent aminotransferase [Jatrophihabitantaceae bacterium]
MNGRVARVSARGQVPPFYAMQVYVAAMARQQAGLPVYLLNVGQPGTPAPSTVLAAAHKVLDTDRIGYTSALGIPELRDAIAGHYRHTYGLDVARSAVVATTGSSGGFLLAFLAAFEPGDVVVLARPGYPAYRNMLTALGCRVVELPCGPATRFQPSVAALDALDVRPAGLVVASPANPTGTMVTPAELAAITTWCDANGVRLISDEIYHGITFSGEASCAWQTSRRAIVVNSFSKYFSMTGWRLGWLLVPDELLDSVDRLASNFTLCPPTLPQHAAVAAFDAYAELDANVEHYRANREFLLARLPEIGLDRLAPADGAFYIYADVSRWTDDSLAFGARLLTETGVAVAPGIDFDPVDGGRYIRLSFAGDEAEIATAVDLLGEWLSRV